MFFSFTRVHVVVRNAKKIFNTIKRTYKVMVAGAAGCVGEPLSLLLKQNPIISHLSLYDVAPVVNGIAIDLSHMDTKTTVTGHCGPDNISEALNDVNLVIIAAGVPFRDPRTPPEFLFDTNAQIVAEIATYIATIAPDAIVAVVTDPIDSLVPVVAEIMKKKKVYNPSNILGVTSLDVMRTATFVGEVNNVNPLTVIVPVIGGNAQNTVIPLFSQSKPPLKCDEARMKTLTKKVNIAYAEVARAKQCTGSSTLAMAFAAARFANSILSGLSGVNDVIESAYVNSSVTSSPYFSTPLLFGKNGVSRNLGYGKLSNFEEKLVSVAIPLIWQSVRKGQDYVLHMDTANMNNNIF